jgi:predicted Zn-dependent protease
MKKILILSLSFLLFNSCAKNPVTGKREVMLMSTEQEVAIGQQSDPEIVSMFGLYEDKALQQFINEKGQQMAAVSHRKELKYEFKIVDSPIINAFAVPGGYVYFTRGIMAHFNNEAEFAGVLGHEIGHITARHSAKQQSRAMLAQLGLVAGMIVSPQLAQFGEAAQSGLGLLFLKFGRDAERESDRLGVEYSTKIGYDAEKMAEFFHTLERSSKQSGAEEVPNFLSTHPNPGDRYKTVKKLAAEAKGQAGAAELKVSRDNYLKMIDGIIYGEDPKQGFVENNVFYHPVLKFQFPVPQGWTLQNTPQQVQMAPKDGNALMMLALAPGKTLEEAARTLLEQYKLTPVESKKETVNGLPAIAIIADQQQQQQQGQQQQQQGQQARVLMYLIEHGGNIYNFLGASSAKNFNTYGQAFSSVMTRFAVLTDASKINRQPAKVRVKPARQTGTLAQVLRDHQTKDAQMAELAILNGMELTDKVEAGTLIKVLEGEVRK